ncbi:MAG: hypothetical protein LBB98_09875, partial [Treponema sp.]|nr:hypothetical protein [Treponema sp.]
GRVRKKQKLSRIPILGANFGGLDFLILVLMFPNFVAMLHKGRRKFGSKKSDVFFKFHLKFRESGLLL